VVYSSSDPIDDNLPFSPIVCHNMSSCVPPSDLAAAGIKEDELEILKDYDTVIIVDDSGSMKEPLWSQVQYFLSPLSVELNVGSYCVPFLGVRCIG